jgi:ABC transport system ATP-binding/permease protein
MQDQHYNESLEDFSTNKNDLKKIVEFEGELVQKSNLVYLSPEGGFFDAHFYAPHKNLFGLRLTTLSANIMMIWFLTILMAILLYFDGLKKGLDKIESIFNKLQDRKPKKEVLEQK